MDLTKQSMMRTAATEARQANVPEELVYAMIEVESSWNPWAWNPEPRYRWFWNVKGNFPFRAVTDLEIANKIPPTDFPCYAGDRDQEWWGQQASWGLMQTMGAVAREMGFTGIYLTQLVDPRISIHYGVKYLSTLRKRFYTLWGWRGVVGAYNAGNPAGSDPIYIQKVALHLPNPMKEMLA